MYYKYITETFLSWTIITENYSSLSNQKGANLCLQNTFGGRPGPAGGAYALPNPLLAMVWGATSKGREGKGGGLLIRGWREG